MKAILVWLLVHAVAPCVADPASAVERRLHELRIERGAVHKAAEHDAVGDDVGQGAAND